VHGGAAAVRGGTSVSVVAAAPACRGASRRDPFPPPPCRAVVSQQGPNPAVESLPSLNTCAAVEFLQRR
jgi:hypothetical protein